MYLYLQYFKEITKQIFLKQVQPDEIDYQLIKPIENTHYWFDFYKNIANKIYFIDYPDRMQYKVLARYVEKRYNNDREQFLLSSKKSLPEFVQPKVTLDNCMQLFAIQWKKNLSGWRSNTGMTAVSLEKFSDIISMQTIVEKIIDQPIGSKKDFEQIYLPWREKNQDFFV